jgi:ATP-dependent RNA helicase DDX51/DBP6
MSLDDIPAFAKTYIHRSGRTARAGQEGKAISLLKRGQVGNFRKMRQLIKEPHLVRPMSIPKHLVRGSLQAYRQSVAILREVLDAEQAGELSHTATLTDEYLSRPDGPAGNEGDEDE